MEKGNEFFLVDIGHVKEEGKRAECWYL